VPIPVRRESAGRDAAPPGWILNGITLGNVHDDHTWTDVNVAIP
jgi:hypothetical protein